jgi:hypothetical protein
MEKGMIHHWLQIVLQWSKITPPQKVRRDLKVKVKMEEKSHPLYTQIFPASCCPLHCVLGLETWKREDRQFIYS